MITLEFYAALKDYFPAVLEIDEGPANVGELRGFLSDKETLATSLLFQCRFAVDDRFVDEGYRFGEGDVVLVIPPSSGG